jgi:hypothetical protein
MKVLGLLRADRESEAGTPPSPALMRRMLDFIEEVTRAGVLVSTNGLQPSSSGVRVRLSDGGEVKVTEGPFSDSKELIASYAVLEVKDMKDAIEWTRRFLEALGGGECEVRPIYDPAEFLMESEKLRRFDSDTQRQ